MGARLYSRELIVRELLSAMSLQEGEFPQEAPGEVFDRLEAAGITPDLSDEEINARIGRLLGAGAFVAD